MMARTQLEPAYAFAHVAVFYLYQGQFAKAGIYAWASWRAFGRDPYLCF